MPLHSSRWLLSSRQIALLRLEMEILPTSLRFQWFRVHTLQVVLRTPSRCQGKRQELRTVHGMKTVEGLAVYAVFSRAAVAYWVLGHVSAVAVRMIVVS